MAAPTATSEDVMIEMPEQNHYRNNIPPAQTSSVPPSVNPSSNPSLNVSRADSLQTEDLSDIGADREAIGMRYACPTLGCGTPEKPVYSNPQYAQGTAPGKRRYPTLDRPPSRAASQSTVHSTNQSTADLVGKKGEPPQPDSGVVAKCKSFWKDPRYDKLRAIVLIVILVLILLLIIILPIVLRKPSESNQPSSIGLEYEVVYAPLPGCGNLLLEGYKKEGVTEFRGIPYAVPPLNERRWMAAVPADIQNCRDLTHTKAHHFGHRCYQSRNVRKDAESEDCLYINVWTPVNRTTSAKVPVMVYFHDGDFISGSGADISRYPLSKIVREGQFVLVSMNFRLQAMGFMALEALPDATNAGLTDMIAALKWVQENIPGFGGDIAKVTAFGLGSGATAILALLNSAEASGLFHRAWLMSPGVVQDTPASAAMARNGEFLKNIGCQLPSSSEIKRCLYEKTADVVLNAVPWYNGPEWALPAKYDIPQMNNGSGPYIVNDKLIRSSNGTFGVLRGEGLLNAMPIIIGNAAVDAEVRPPQEYFGDGTSVRILNDYQFRENVQRRLVAFDPDIMARIQIEYPNLETELGFTRLVSDIRALCPINYVADLISGKGTQVYRYIHDFPPAMRVNAFNNGYWAKQSFYGIDMLAFFGALDGEELSPYFTDPGTFAGNFRKEIYRFIKDEAMTWSPLPRYMSLTASAATAKLVSSPAYPRNCTYWSELNMIPEFSWSN